MPSVFRLDNGIEQVSTTAQVDTSTNAPSILAINGFFCGITVFVVLARIYVRVIMLKTMGTDDYLITAATASQSFFSLRVQTGICQESVVQTQDFELDNVWLLNTTYTSSS